MRKFKTVISLNPDHMDSDNVSWAAPDGSAQGSGYRSKNDKKIHVLRCPACHKENYAPAVHDGACAFCGFDPNPESSDG